MCQVVEGVVVLKPQQDPPTVPMDYTWAKQLGLVRKPAEFVTSISDERGEELLYAGMPISKTFEVRVSPAATHTHSYHHAHTRRLWRRC